MLLFLKLSSFDVEKLIHQLKRAASVQHLSVLFGNGSLVKEVLSDSENICLCLDNTVVLTIAVQKSRAVTG
uniref:RNA chaperone Hfq n=1 Tax=Steinernema glaseri TaxID=37863 RepID=A0A1I8ACA7_9BILA